MLKNLVLVLVGGIGGAVVIAFLFLQLREGPLPEAVEVPAESNLALEYQVPDGVNIRDIEVPDKAPLSEGLEIELPEQTVSPEYAKALNGTMNAAVAIEQQVKSNIAAEAAQVQQSALKGDYQNLFMYMNQVKIETVKARELTADLRTATMALNNESADPNFPSSVKAASVRYADNLTELADTTDAFTIALDSGMTGESPSQEQVTEIERLLVQFDVHISQFVKDIRALTGAIKAATEI